MKFLMGTSTNGYQGLFIDTDVDEFVVLPVDETPVFSGVATGAYVFLSNSYLFIIDPVSRQLVTKISTPGTAYGGEIAPDGRIFIGTNSAPYVYYCTVTDHELHPVDPVFDSMNGYVSDISFHPSGSMISCSGGFTNRHRIWDMETGDLLHTESISNRWSYTESTTQWSPDGKHIIWTQPSSVTSRRPILARYDEVSGTFEDLPDTTDQDIIWRGSTFSRDGTYCVFIGSNGQLVLCKVTETGLQQQDFLADSSSGTPTMYRGVVAGFDNHQIFAGWGSEGIQEAQFVKSVSLWRGSFLDYNHESGFSRTLTLIKEDLIEGKALDFTSPAIEITSTGALPNTTTAQGLFSSPATQLDFDLIISELILASFSATSSLPSYNMAMQTFIESILASDAFGIADKDYNLLQVVEIQAQAVLDILASLELDNVLGFIETIKTSSSLSSEYVGHIDLTTAAYMLDASVLEQAIYVLSALELSSTETVDLRPGIQLLSQMFAESTATNITKQNVNFAAALALLDFYKSGYVLDAESLVAFEDTFASYLRKLLEEQESMDLASAEDLSSAVNMLLVSYADMQSEHEHVLSGRSDYLSKFKTTSLFRFDGDLYEGWILNLGVDEGQNNPHAFTQYHNYNFTSIVELGGKHYGVADDGLYVLEGDSDDGDPIASSIKTGLISFGSQNIKDANNFYLGYTSSGEMVLKAVSLQKGKKREDWYRIKESSSSGFNVGRARIQRGVRSAYWQFELVNKDGADFDVESVTLEYQILSRRIRR